MLTTTRKLKGYCRSALRFCNVQFQQIKPDPSRKNLYLNISHNRYCRYLYPFIKFFHLEGYSIYLPNQLRIFHHLTDRNDYVYLLLEEKIVRFGKPSRIDLYLDGKNLRPDYFTGLHFQTQNENSYFIPMPQHPLMYHYGLWDQNIPEINRKRSVFMAGNFDAGRYYQIETDGLFKTLSRPKVHAFLAETGRLFPMRSLEELNDYIRGNREHDVLLIDRLLFDVPMNKLRKILASFDFFFALPGVLMPFSHNIVEAMSAGCIPFIDKEYASLFRPVLEDGVTAITFKDKSDIIYKLNVIKNMSQEKLSELRQNVYQYYYTHMTPAGVVSTIANRGFDKIYLQSELHSVNLFKRSMASARSL